MGAFYDFVKQSSNPMMKEWAKQNPPESLRTFHRELGDFLSQIDKKKKKDE